MKNIFILLLSLISFQLLGRIEIANIFPTTSENDCSGIIQLNLVGTGGPFKVVIEETGQILENVEGLVPIENLCLGIYSIHVSIAGFSNCEKILSAEIIAPPSVQSNILALNNSNNITTNTFPKSLETKKRNFTQEEITITPNPNDGHFKIYFNQDVSAKTFFEIYSTQGQLIYSSTIFEKETIVNLPKFIPNTYFIRFIRDNSLIQTNEIIVH